MTEADGNGRLGLRQALAGTQIERHTAPTPVVDVKAHRQIGLYHGSGIDVFFFSISDHALSIDVAGAVLSSDNGVF